MTVARPYPKHHLAFALPPPWLSNPPPRKVYDFPELAINDTMCSNQSTQEQVGGVTGGANDGKTQDTIRGASPDIGDGISRGQAPWQIV